MNIPSRSGSTTATSKRKLSEEEKEKEQPTSQKKKKDKLPSSGSKKKKKEEEEDSKVVTTTSTSASHKELVKYLQSKKLNVTVDDTIDLVTVVVDTADQCDIVVALVMDTFRKEEPSKGKGCVVGFDVEFLKNNTVATVQFATKSIACVVRAGEIWNKDKRLPRSLKSFLEDPDVLKVGVAVGSDAVKIKKSFDQDTMGLVDVAVMAMKLGLTNGYHELNVLARIIDEEKGTSNGGWEGNLSSQQIKYASKDAWLGYMIARRICNTLADNLAFIEWLQKNRPTEKETLEFTKFWTMNQSKRDTERIYKPQLINPNTDLPRTIVDAKTVLESFSKQKQYQRANDTKLESLLGQMKQNQGKPKSSQTTKPQKKDEVILANLIT